LSEWLEPIGWFNILTLSLTVIFGILTIIFFFKSLNVRAPRYAIHSFKVLELRVGDMPLKMLYADQEIERLTATKIAFWNAGRSTINSQDVPEPITVQVKDRCKILNARILQVKNPVNNFHIPSYTQTNVPLFFNYVDKDEGAVIQILHTGESSKDIEIRGTIKGAGKLTRVPIMRPHFLRDTLWLTMITVASAIAFLAYGISQAQALFVVVSSFAAGSAIGIVSGYGTRLYRSRIPKGFDSFEEGPEKI